MKHFQKCKKVKKEKKVNYISRNAVPKFIRYQNGACFGVQIAGLLSILKYTRQTFAKREEEREREKERGYSGDLKSSHLKSGFLEDQISNGLFSKD